MTEYSCKVVPFRGSINSGGSADEVGRQLESLVNTHSSDGLELHQVTEVNIEVNLLFGCAVRRKL